MVATSNIISINQIDEIFHSLKTSFIEVRKEKIASRRQRLSKLKKWIHENRPQIHQAMFNDFKKPSVEVDAIELFHVLNEIDVALNNLERWTSPKKVDAPITMIGTRSFIQCEPRGVCLIISPWNYPFSLAIGPLVSALAAGNCVIIKPSELTPNVSALLRQMTEEIFDKKVVVVIEGGPETSKHLIHLPFDHIFFTGSPQIGKTVMKAAAENLTSVTLELGGKSPSIVTASANLKDAAQRTTVAKFVNNGQTCIAPDYVLVHESISQKFIEEVISQTKRLFGENENFQASKSYSRIVNDRHFSRISALIEDAINTGAKVEWSGESDPSSRFIHPVILSDVAAHARVMREEIFGPVLPMLTFKSIDEAIRIVNDQPKALALYIFTQRKSDWQQILNETSAGGVCINDSGIHFLHHNLPFGGVNNSGLGKSHGHYGFLAFSHEKPVLKQRNGLTSVRAFYPPYTTRTRQLMDWFLKLF